VSLCGTWLFRADPNGDGNKQNWFRIDRPSGDWREVQVPHTWQVEPGFVDYRSVGWYWRTFDVPERWADAAVRLEFEAVFHSATVWINGQQAGEHLRKGYTAFALDISHLLRLGQSNLVVVRVDGSFDMHMLPRGRQSDWAHDGGIFRPVQLLVTPKTFIDRIEVEAVPDLMTAGAALTITAHCRNTGASIWTGGARFRVVDEATELAVVEVPEAGSLDLPAGTSQTQTFRATLPAAKLWHFDHPNLYRLEFSIANVRESHQLTTTFGVRRFEIKDGGFLLNGEPVRLMGVERMGGSNPDFGMAEPWDLIKSDHDDLKRLNCVFTRVHWPQDRRVLDYCDRYGILMQSEVPAWGGDTFEGVGAEPDADILENGLEQLREMITRDRNHPSIIAWGLCNEIWGSNPPAYQFARRLLEEAKKLDPRRLCSYASNSLAEHPEKDVAGLMDIIEANEYFGTWAPGTVEDMTRHLDRLHAVFPGKPIVISEYGYCACTPDRPEGDVSRIEVLRSHTAVFRSKPFVGGAIFFCYNDYRTHVGDRGVGPLVQRVHGVVDLYGHPKPSYAVLREESSPIESLSVENRTGAFLLQLKTRADFPRYTLRGYRLRAVLFGKGEVPEEQQEVALPELAPGGNFSTELRFGPSAALHVDFDVLRPTRISVHTLRWKP
jgi:beta-glucuronidase